MNKTMIALLVLFVVATFVQTAAAAAQTRRQTTGTDQQYRQRGYYNQNGTRYYDGYPLSELEKMRARW